MPINKEGKLTGTGRHDTKYTYTLRDIAKVTGYKLSYLYKMKQQGLLNPNSLLDVIEFIDARRKLRSIFPRFKPTIKI